MKREMSSETGSGAGHAGGLLTRTDLMGVLKVPARTLRRWKKQGLPVYQRGKVIRYALAEVQAWMKMRDDSSGLENQAM